MDFKRIFKTPLFWVLAVIVVMLTVFSFDGNGGYTTVTTAQAEKLITDKKVETAVLTTANVLTLDLKPGHQGPGRLRRRARRAAHHRAQHQRAQRLQRQEGRRQRLLDDLHQLLPGAPARRALLVPHEPGAGRR